MQLFMGPIGNQVETLEQALISKKTGLKLPCMRNNLILEQIRLPGQLCWEAAPASPCLSFPHGMFILLHQAL